ncbi:MAG TPA: HDIG domain-containing protein [Candidatus Limnocylindrales bacterium]|jgi:putative nucleotidyltransferase with HDIG domain|nr:HDIG domain-containing protein [Candidatus Limnocylindrales bacterium]
MLSANVEPAGTRFTRRDLGRLIALSALLALAMSVVLGLDVLPAQDQLEQGKPAPANVVAPATREYTSDVLTAEARDAARKAVVPQYDFTIARGASVAAEQVRELERKVAPIDAAFADGVSDEDRATILEDVLIGGLSDDDRATLLKLDAKRWQAVRTESSRVLDTVERSELRDTELPLTKDGVENRFAGDLTAAESSLGAALIRPLVVPNSSFSADMTEAARSRAAEGVKDVPKSWERGETIVRAGDRVDAVAWEAINFYRLNEGGLDVARLVGFAVFSVLVIGLLLTWTWRFRREFWHRNNVLLLLALLLLFAVFALKLTAGRPWLPYALPLAAVGMIVAVLLDAGAAMVMTALIALLAAAVSSAVATTAAGTSAGVELAAYVLLGGIAGIVAVRRGDRLTVFVQAGFAVFIVNMLVVATFGLFGDHDVYGVVQLMGAAAVSAGGAAVATVGSFAVLGSLFGILTAFQLLELANPSQPLLRRLLVETPGTYHHSLMVGNLAERAAEAIGADPLLARVAAYYHDIGKLSNPVAFIENQAGGENIHDVLDPETSAQLLKSHVSEGIDIAYKSGLPKALIAFIPQHHGTAVMSYFYARAREQAAEPYGGLNTAEGRKAADAVDIRKFRHGGPKPQVREAAIIMLADSVEASVRSLSSRDEAAIRAMVSRIIEERIADDQFDECDLTLRDIELIREAFVAQLLGMYHQRVAYPQNKVVELESRRAAGDQ